MNGSVTQLDAPREHGDGGTILRRGIQLLLRAALIACALMLLGWALGRFLPAKGVSAEAATGVLPTLLSFLSSLLLAVALAYPVSHSRLGGRSLFGAVFLAVFGLATVLTLVEAALFLRMTAGALLIEAFKTTLTAAVLSWLAVRLYPGALAPTATLENASNPPTIGSWVRRWVGVSLLYVVLYITAGLLILPWIRTWYEAQGTLEPDPAFFLPFQVARGALFVACVLPLLRSMEVRRRQASLAMAVMIPLVHGVAGLIPSNPFMPDSVRYAHMIEIGWSNFVLGLLIGYLFWNPQARSGR